MVNNVTLIGRLTKDPELRQSSAGNAVCSFTLAVDTNVKNPDGTRNANFFSVIVFSSNKAELVSKYARKGSLVAIVGKLNQRIYVRSDGSKASIVEIIADTVQFLEKRNVADEETPSFNDEPTVQDILSDDEKGDDTKEELNLNEDSLPF